MITSCLLFLPNVQANEQEGETPASAKEFVRGALDASEAELRAGKLAQTKAQNREVQELGQSMMEDHRQIQERLRNLAREHGLDPKVTLQSEHQTQIAKLQNASNAEFDRVFLEQVIRDHKRDLAMLEDCAKKFKDDAKLSALIEEQMPTVREHLETAQNIQLENIRLREGQASAGALKEPRDTEFLGLPTSNTDGTVLGLFPAPSRVVEAGAEESYIAEELADGKVDPDVDTVFEADRDAVGAPPTWEREAAAGKFIGDRNLPEKVRATLREKGWTEQEGGLKRISVYEAEINGKTIHVTENGELLKTSAGSEQK